MLEISYHTPMALCWCSSTLGTHGQTIWKYNTLYHLASEHSTGNNLPKIPRELLIKMYITQEEETALGISQQTTAGWRTHNDIPDSDGLLQLTRRRSDTVFTVDADSRDAKRQRMGPIVE